MLDNPAYRVGWERKREAYLKEGVEPWTPSVEVERVLIESFDDSGGGLNAQAIAEHPINLLTHDDLSRPQPVQIRECQLSVEVVDVVLHVDDEAALAAAVLGPAQPSADHLEVQVRAVDGTGDQDRTGLWRVESFAEDTVVDEDVDLPARKSSTTRRRTALSVVPLTARAVTPFVTNSSSSAKTVAASSNVTPCFRALLAAFAGSHSNSNPRYGPASVGSSAIRALGCTPRTSTAAPRATTTAAPSQAMARWGASSVGALAEASLRLVIANTMRR